MEIGKSVKHNWIQKATKSMEERGTKGSFTRWCKANGYGGVTGACIAAGLKSKNPSIRKKAAFARAMHSIQRKKQ